MRNHHHHHLLHITIIIVVVLFSLLSISNQQEVQCTTRTFRDSLSSCPLSSANYTMRLAASVSISKTDNFFQYGKQMANSFHMAVDHINSNIENVSVYLELCEDFSDATIVVSNAQASMHSTDFYLGPYSSSLTNTLANFTTNSNMLLASSAAASSSVFENRSLIFGILPPANVYPTSSIQVWSDALGGNMTFVRLTSLSLFLFSILYYTITSWTHYLHLFLSVLELHSWIFRRGFHLHKVDVF